jgi:hypothetical protein
MAELRMRIFSNRDKQQTLEELEEQVNEFLAGVYQVERILQSGGDYFTTITLWYWERPSELGAEETRELRELEREIGDGVLYPEPSESPATEPPAGTAEVLSHPRELAAQGVRSLNREAGMELVGLDTTLDDLRHGDVEAQFLPQGPEEEPPRAEAADASLGDAIAESLTEELRDEPPTPPAHFPMTGPAELAWEHARELHRLEDGMLTWLEQLTAFRAAYPLAGAELLDFLLSEETLVQMVEQVRSASEELAGTMREYALSHGFQPWQRPEARPDETLTGAEPVERKTWSVPSASEGELQRLRGELGALRRQVDDASERKNFLVRELKDAASGEDAGRRNSVSDALEAQQKRLADLHRDLRRARGRLNDAGGAGV